MSPNQAPERFVADPKQVSQELLEPVLRFIQESGITHGDALEAFEASWKRASKSSKSQVRLSSLGDPQPYVDIITAWTRHPDYLDRNGCPRQLAASGKSSFATLVRAAAPGLNARDALNVLRAYGNIEISRAGKITLTKPFFHIRTGEKLAFEPNVRFLVDAARNVKQSLASGPQDGGLATQHFWRAVDTRSIPTRRVKKFLEFVKAQSLTFLQDVDDWLAENSASRATRSVTRVGLGMFTFGQDRPEG